MKKAVNIEWDLFMSEETLGSLPKELVIPNGLTDKKAIEDYIAEKTHYRPVGFEILHEAQPVARKVLFTHGMSNVQMLIITDAPSSDIEFWCIRYNEQLENGGHCELFDTLKAKYFVKELLDSKVDDAGTFDVLGFDEVYDLSNYNKKELAYKVENRIFVIHECDEGYDYSIISDNYRLIDGGIITDPSMLMTEALCAIIRNLATDPDALKRGNVSVNSERISQDYEEVFEKMEEADDDFNKKIAWYYADYPFLETLEEFSLLQQLVPEMLDSLEKEMAWYDTASDEDIGECGENLSRFLVAVHGSGETVTDWLIELCGRDKFPVYGDYLKIIIEGTTIPSTGEVSNGIVVTKFPKEKLTFEKVVEVAKENGFKDGCFTLIAESAREGKIYRYDEIEGETPMWYEVGTTIGYT